MTIKQNQEVQRRIAQFAPVKEHIESKEFLLLDLFDIIAGNLNEYPDIASAMVFHVRDILLESATGADMSGAKVISEMYWRTFFSPEGSKKYGTEHIAKDQDIRQSLVETLLLGGKEGMDSHDIHQQPSSPQ